MKSPHYSFFKALFCLGFLSLSLFSINLSAQCPDNEADLANGGTFSGNCTVNVGGSITVTGDIIWTSGRLTINETGVGGGDGDLYISSGGSITIQNGATLDMDDGDITVNDGAELTVESGGAVEILDGSGRDFTINGTVTIESGASVDVDDYVYVNSTGILIVAGTIESDNDFEIDGGSVTVQSGGDLDSGDDIQVFDGGSLVIDEGGSANTSGNDGDVMNSDDDGNPENGESQGTIVVNGTLTVSNDVDIIDTTPSSSLTGSGTVTASGNFTDEEEGDFYDCDGGGDTCSPTEPYVCDESTECTPGGCPDEDDLEAGGVFCGDCSIDIGGTIDIDENVCWVSGTLTITGNNDANFNIEDGGNLTVVSGTIDIQDGDLNVEDGGSLGILDDGAVEVDDYLNVDGTVEMSGDLTTGNDVQIDGGTLAVLDGGNLDSGDDIQVYNSGILVVQEGGTASTSGGNGDVMNSDDDGNPSNGESQGTIIIDGTLDVDRDVVIVNTNPDSGINGNGTIIVDDDYTDGEGGDFEDCGGGTCSAEAPLACDETTVCVEDNCPADENDLENGGTFCGDCYLDINNTIDLEADVCWVSGTLTLDGDGGDGDFSMDDGVTFTVVSGTVIIEDGDANISPGADLVILEDAIFSVADDLIVEEGAGVVVDGLLDVTDNIEIGETLTGGIVVNEGGSANAQRVDGEQPADEDDLPDNIDLSNGGGFNVNGVELPVELLSFTGELYENNLIAYLRWSTASEIDNRGFYVERSLDGLNFKKIGFVEGKGSTTDAHEYTFMDQTINVSSYYRLRQIDFDGVHELSHMIFVSLIAATSNDPISIYPNPTYGEVSFDGLKQEVYDIQVMNLSGKVVVNLMATSLEDSEIAINRYLGGATKGVYLIRFSNPGYSETIRLIRK